MPFTQAQFEQLSDRDRRLLQGVAEYLGYDNYTGAEPEAVFEILADTDGCVPESEIGDDLWQAIRRKFACIFWPVTCLLAESIGCEEWELSLFIDPDHEDSTRLVIIHEPQQQVLLTFAAEAWGFHFDSLAKIIDFIDEQLAAAKLGCGERSPEND